MYLPPSQQLHVDHGPSNTQLSGLAMRQREHHLIKPKGRSYIYSDLAVACSLAGFETFLMSDLLMSIPTSKLDRESQLYNC